MNSIPHDGDNFLEYKTYTRLTQVAASPLQKKLLLDVTLYKAIQDGRARLLVFITYSRTLYFGTD